MRARSEAPIRLAAFRGAAGRGWRAAAGPSAATASHPGIDAALVDLERALVQDRAHAVVAAPPGPAGANLLQELEARLVGSLHTVRLPEPSVGEDEVCGRILEALGGEGGPGAEAGLLGLTRELAQRGSALVLLVAEAGSMQAATLRRLGRLAAAVRPGLRLALVVGVESWEEPDPVAGLVAALGVGAEKVELHTPATRTAPGPSPVRAPERPAAPVPAPPSHREAAALRQKVAWPRRSPPPARAVRAAVRDAYRAGSGRPPLAAAVALAIAVLLLIVQLLADPAPPREGIRLAASVAAPLEPVRPPPEPPAPPRAPPAASPPPVAAPATPSPAPPPARAGTAAPTPPSRAEAPAPAVPRIRVSFNARPWARIEMDGRELGITPLAGIRVTRGPHRFRAHLPDGRVIERTLEIDTHRDHVSFP